MLDTYLFKIKKHIPNWLFSWTAPTYHYLMALCGAIVYRFPSRKITVVAITGTKGKSSVTEILNSILIEAGYKTALTNTIRFKVGDMSEDNLYKMSMPGRFFMQRFLRRAVKARCRYAIIEMTSQGAEMYRHRFIDIDTLIVTNIMPEHIEAHGSYENYIEAKLKIARAVASSPKDRNMIIVNKEDVESVKFLTVGPVEKYEYSIDQAKPFTLGKQGISFVYENLEIHSPLSGEFNIYNSLAAMTYAKTQGVSVDVMKNALEKFSGIRGRVEHIEEGQDFSVIVDYAHTPDSLQKLYDVFQNTRRICVLGNTGGGRDKWKRDEMAHIAERSCDEIILTNEDPYDDDPMEIITDMAKVIKEKEPRIILDRREAITHAFSIAKTGDSVLITGKGTDPYIMGPNNTKITWSDADVAREEIKKLTKKI